MGERWGKIEKIVQLFVIDQRLMINNMILSQKTYSKLKWTSEQEQFLRELKEQKHIESWKIISNQMNKIFSEKNRTGKQCRERYMNYIRFQNNLKYIAKWTYQEDLLLFEKFIKYGAKWVQIGKEMENRSENCLKNRFYGAMRKIIRKINRAVKEKKLKQKKPIKTELLIRILQTSNEQFKQNTTQQKQSLQFIDELKKQMIKIAINSDENLQPNEIENLINNISKFCLTTKLLSKKKLKLGKKQSGGSQNQNQFLKSNINGYQNEQIDTGNEELKKDDENKTLTDKNQYQLTHKIIRNYILFSTEQNKSQEKGQFNVIKLFSNKLNEIEQ